MAKRQLDSWIKGYLEYVDESEAPINYHLWTAVSIIAACLQRKCWLSWDWLTYPNFYNILVGPTGTGKGTAMNYGFDFINTVGIPLAPDSTTRAALTQLMGGDAFASSYIDETGKQVIHSSMTVFAAEFNVFVDFQDRTFISMLNDLYDCRDPFIRQTKGAGIDTIRNPFLNILGGTTPETFRETITSSTIGSGFLGRLIIIYEKKRGKIVIFPFVTKYDSNLKIKLIADLTAIASMCGQFKFTEDFLKFWGDWYPKQVEDPPFTDYRFEGYCNRRGKHVLKLCMVISASESDNKVINANHAQTALTMLEGIEPNMPELLGGIGRSPYAGVTSDAMKFIREMKTVMLSELVRRFYRDATHDEMMDIVRGLCIMRMCKMDKTADDIKITWIDDKNIGLF